MEFAIVRAGTAGSATRRTSSSRRTRRARWTRAAPRGVLVQLCYHAGRGAEEAALCSEVLEPYRGRLEFPVYFDYEYDSERYAKEHDVSPDRELRTQLICAFCAELERRGWRAGVYTNNDYLKNRVDASRLSPWELWLADYSGGPDAAAACSRPAAPVK